MTFDLNGLKDAIVNAKDLTDEYAPEDIEKNKIISAIATIPFIFWLPLVVNGDSKFGKFYANQGLILTVLCVVLSIISDVAGRVLWMIPLLGHILSSLLALIVVLIVMGEWLFLLVYALQGKAKEMPFIGNIFCPFK